MSGREWIRMRVSDFSEYWNKRQKNVDKELAYFERKCKVQTNCWSICMCYYFGLRCLFFISFPYICCLRISIMANPIGGEPHTFYMCPVYFKRCKSASSLTQHRNSEHWEFTPESVDGAHTNASTFDFHPLLTGKLTPVVHQKCY